MINVYTNRKSVALTKLLVNLSLASALLLLSTTWLSGQDCNADAGTATLIYNGMNNDGIICPQDYMEFGADAGSYMLPPGTSPGIMFAIYRCPPTRADIDSDPCWTQYYWTGEHLTYYNDGSIQAIVGGNQVWFVAIASDNTNAPNHDANEDGCYALGDVFRFTLLDAIEVYELPDDNPCDNTIKYEVSGVNRPNDFYVENRGAGTVTQNGFEITVSNLTNNGMYRFQVFTTNGCPVEISGTFRLPTTTQNADFMYPSFCESQVGLPTGIVTPGGTFRFNPQPNDGATINPTTGAISNATAGTQYFVEYTTPGTPIACPGTRIQPVVVTTRPAAPVIGTPIFFCFGEPATITPTGSTENYRLYDNPALTSPLQTGTSFNITNLLQVVGQDYTFYLTSVQGNCESLPKEIVVRAVQVTPPTVSPNPIIACLGDVVEIEPISSSATASTFCYYAEPSLSESVRLATGRTYTFPAGNRNVVYVTEVVNGCESDAVRVDIQISTPPVPRLDTLIEVCTGVSVMLSPNGAPAGTVYNFYSDANLTNLLHTGASYSVTANGPQDIYVTATLNGCTSEAVRVRITTSLPGVPELASPVPICTGNSPPTLTGTGTGGTLEWYDTDPLAPNVSPIGTGNSFTPTISTTTPGDYTFWATTTTPAGCKSPPASVTVQIRTGPEPPQVADVAQCAGLDAPRLSASGASNQFAWYTADPANGNVNPVIIAPTFLPTVNNTVPGIYTFWVAQVESEGCESVAVPINIIIQEVAEVPTVDQLDFELCVGQELPTFTASSGVGTISWYEVEPTTGTIPLQTGPSFQPNVDNTFAGSYTYWVNSAVPSGCNSESFRLTLTYTDAIPTPTVEPLVGLCAGDALPTLTATGTGNTTINWYDTNPIATQVIPVAMGSSFVPTIDNTTPGTHTFWVTQSTASGCESDAVPITVEVRLVPDAPVVNMPFPICRGTAIPSFLATGGGVFFNWYDSDPSIGNPTPVGTGVSFRPTIDSTVIGDYQFWVTQSETPGCESPAAIVILTITGSPDAPAVAFQDTSICINGAAPLLAATGNGGMLQWFDSDPVFGGTPLAAGNSFQPTIDVSQAGSFTFWVNEASAAACTGIGAQVTIHVLEPPAPPVGAPIQGICTGETISTLTVTGLGGIIRWYDEDPTVVPSSNFLAAGSEFTPDASSAVPADFNFWVTETNAAGCVSTPTLIQLSITDTPPVPGQDTVLVQCVGEAIPQLTTQELTGRTVNWYTENPSQNPTASPIATGGTFTPTLDNTVAGTSFIFATLAVGSCESEPMTFEIVYRARPTAPTVTGPQEICAGDPAPTFEAGTTDGQFNWYNEDPSGGGILPLNIGNTFSPTFNTAVAGTYTFWATETSEDGCEGSPAEFTLRVNELPTPTFESSCSEDLPIYSLTVTSNADVLTASLGTVVNLGNGQFTINDISTQTDSIHLTLTITSTGCSQDFSLATPVCSCPFIAPAISSGDVAICEEEDITPLEVTLSSSNLTVNWYSDSVGGVLLSENSTIFIAPTAGTYFAESQSLTNGCVSDLRTPVTLTINSLPQVLDSTTNCAADLNTYATIVSFDRAVTIVASEGTIVDEGSNTFTISGLTPGRDLELAFTDAVTACENTFTITAPTCLCPTVTAPISTGDIDICESEIMPTLSVLAATDMAIDWYSDATGSTLLLENSVEFQPTTSGTFYAESRHLVTNCVSNTRTPVTLTIHAKPELALASVIQPNCDGNTGSLQANVNSGAMPYIFQLNNDAPQSEGTFTNLGVGEYSIMLVDANGCADSLTTTLAVEGSLTVVANVNGILTCTTEQVVLDGSNSTGAANLTFEWSNGAGTLATTPQAEVSEAGVYTLFVSSANCEASATVEVQQDRAPVSAHIAAADAITCTTTSVLLDGSASTSGETISYQWLQNGQAVANGQTPVLEVSAPGTYELVVTNSVNGCTDSRSMTVAENRDFPEVQVTQEGVLNCINNEIRLNGSASTPSGNLDFLWQNNNGTPLPDGNTSQVRITEAGIYLLQITNVNNGCSSSTNVEVTADRTPPVANAGSDREIPCEASSVQLNGSNSSSGAQIIYQWIDLSTGNTIAKDINPSVTAAGLYQLIVTNEANGCTATDSVEVLPPTTVANEFSIEATPPGCFGQSNGRITVTPLNTAETYVYALNDKPFVNFNEFNSLKAGSYTLTIQNSSGCTYDTLLVLDEGTTLQLDLGDDIELHLGDSIQLEGFVNVDTSTLVSLQWTNPELLSCGDCLTPTTSSSLNRTTSFTLFIADENGCTAEDRITVFVDRTRRIYIPNAFSPNGDGENDFFEIFAGDDVLHIKSFMIFDRWGGLLYEASDFAPNDPNMRWDGQITNGKSNSTFMSNTFVYVVEAEFVDGATEIFSGEISVVR